MADETDEIVVTLEPELPLGDVTKTETPRDESGKFVAKTEPVDELAAQFEEQKAETERAQRERDAALADARRERDEADKARKEATEAKGQIVEREYDTVATGLEAAQAAADAAEREYETAFNAGDGKAMAAAQRKMARAESQVVALGGAKADLEIRKAVKPAEETRRTETPQRQTAADPVEAWIDNGNFTKPTADWMRAHKEWVSDPKKNIQLRKADLDAQEHGLKPDSAEYFAHVETQIGLRQATNSKSNGHAPPNNQNRRRPTVPAAPVNASGGALNGGGTEVRLTAGEARAATDGITHVWNYDDPSGQKKFKKGDPIGTTEMARRKLALSKQGAYDRTYTEQ